MNKFKKTKQKKCYLYTYELSFIVIKQYNKQFLEYAIINIIKHSV